MIELIQRLEQEGFAYVAAGNVYFDVSRYAEYGKLAQLDLEQLRSGARIEVDVNKRHPLDFALWFTRSKFENQELQWDSPWGRGYPGWHIECSAMSMHYLGESFDIHCGGIDHIPVHHTNEIAQSEAATHKPLASIWMHGGFLVADAGKMSKSSGEFLTLDRVTERGIDPISFRLLCLGTTYRSELSWSWQALEGAANALAKVKHRVLQLKEGGADAGVVALSPRGRELREQFREEIFNDLGAPKALKVFYETLNDTTLARDEQLNLLLEMDQVLGLGLDSWKEESIPEAITALAVQRQEARREKRFADADAFRDQILAQGYLLEESKVGFRIRKK
jgi:cysteinyl-tRNA synthetase